MAKASKNGTKPALLEVRGLHVSVDDNEILKGLGLKVNPGEVHAIMGPNGSGKSTLANVIAGRPGYTVTAGEVLFDGRNVLDMTPDQRARAGIFLALQYPIELPGIRNREFLRTAVDSIRESRGEEKLAIRAFNKLLEAKAKELGFDADMLKRNVNEGFSGGEKKRNEVLQLSVLEPRLALMDETDSGLDIDALKVVSEGVNRFRAPDRAIVLVTHYQRILNYITPDFVHVLIAGRIVRSGGRELALELESRGYDWLREETVGAQTS
ncbi:MAG TPA: Fe-S cluster assembly ATPase SufC [Dehalococcoidia bacterium]|nr:Fe-S cluster assembly ATPase SufC [Dehalococcoidia bacterium]